MKIDFHTHCFPDALAPRAMASLHVHFILMSSVSAHTDGTAAAAEALLKSVGVDRAVVCNIATNPRQESKVNQFAIELKRSNPFTIPLGSIHPDSECQDAELDRLLDAGIAGIKLHPDYVGVFLSDPRFDRIFSRLEERGMLCVLHTGYDPVSPNLIHATPPMILDVIKRHPKLRLVAAHMGGFAQAKGALEYLLGEDVYLDTSLCALRPDEREMLCTILQKHDERRLLFGTDTPWGDPTQEIAFLESAGLSPERLERIYHQNAEELLRACTRA